MATPEQLQAMISDFDKMSDVTKEYFRSASPEEIGSAVTTLTFRRRQEDLTTAIAGMVSGDADFDILNRSLACVDTSSEALKASLTDLRKAINEEDEQEFLRCSIVLALATLRKAGI